MSATTDEKGSAELAVGARERKSSAAFTLLELLVAMTIISILAAFLLPSLQRSRELAKRTYCVVNLKQIGLALEMYKDDHGFYFMPPEGSNSGILYQKAADKPEYLGWAVEAGYLGRPGSSGSVFCPSHLVLSKDGPYGWSNYDNDGGTIAIDPNSIISYVLRGESEEQRNSDRGNAAKAWVCDYQRPDKLINGSPMTTHGVEGVNAVFGDGHVKWVAGEFLWNSGTLFADIEEAAK